MDKLPLFYAPQVITKKEYSHGYMRNGVHLDRSAPRELSLHILEHWQPRYCQDCGAEIKKGEIIAHSDMGLYAHCIECVILPDGPLEAWKVTYRLKRKTQKHPKGIFSLANVGTPQLLQEYHTVVSMMYEQVEKRILWTK